MLDKSYSASELVLGLVAAVGTDVETVHRIVRERLQVSGYEVQLIKITRDVLPDVEKPEPYDPNDEYARLIALMNAGDKARRRGDYSILALGAAAFINSKRVIGDESPRPRRAYIISALKHPEEVERLRAIYPQGFHLIGVHASEERRRRRLIENKSIRDPTKVQDLMDRDQDGHEKFGQRVADTFHLSDFFVRLTENERDLEESVWRILALLLGHPYVTPTFDEHAMFMAFVAALHSADLSRQVGAVVATHDQVLALGANDVPKAGGGQYWASDNRLPEKFQFPDDGRDFVHGFDANKVEQQRIIEDILTRGEKASLDRDTLLEVLKPSRIRDLTEFGRIVHAEMDALLACARAGISTREATLYVTTFPCHNCAKHIVAAGIKRVVFVEPYAKSKAADLHEDSISVGFEDPGEPVPDRGRVRFEPFVGVGPRRFFDLFSTGLGSGYPIKRKDDDARKVEWSPKAGRLRLQMLPASYLDLELIASDMFNKARLQEETNGA